MNVSPTDSSVADQESAGVKEAAEQWLDETWRELRNGAGPARMAYFGGAVDVLKDLGILSKIEQEGWIARRGTCPGHDDEGGRVWCAYCGDIPAEARDIDDTEAAS